MVRFTYRKTATKTSGLNQNLPSMRLFRKPFSICMTQSKQKEEECLSDKDTNRTLGAPGFEMFLPSLVICATLGRSLAATSSKT